MKKQWWRKLFAWAWKPKQESVVVVPLKPHTWSKRNIEVAKYIPQPVKVIDFGCGNKEILNFIEVKKYLGVDIEPTADIVANLNAPMPATVSGKWDVALLLGVLEYVDDPDKTMSYILNYSDCFIVLSLITKKKHNWQRAWTPESIDQFLQQYFSSVEHHSISRYILSVCKK